VAEAGGFRVLDFVPWDKLNAPPSGNIKRRDHDAYEFILIAVKSEAYKYHKFRAEYAEKTVKKAAAAARPEFQIDLWGKDHALAADFRQADIEGQLAGGTF
jgi:DNA modification methylase